MKRLNRFLAPIILLLCAALFASPAAAQIVFVKPIGTTSTTTTGTSTSITVPAAGVAAGNSVIVSFAMNPSAGAVSCSDTSGNAYTSNRDITNGSGNSGVRTVVLSAHNISALTSGNSISCTHPSVTARALSANEFSGLATTSTVDKVASATGNSRFPSSGNTTTTAQASELLIGGIGVEGPSTETFTAGASYATIGRTGTSAGNAANNITINPEYRIVSATGAYSATGTLSAKGKWAAAIVTYKAAPPVASKLVITSVNSGSNPTAGVGFPVVVQSQTAGGTTANVVNATGVSLSLKTGTGTLGGTLIGTIAAGTNQVAITGVTYTKAENGVVITARTSGDNLSAGDSAPFTVIAGAAAKVAFSTQPGNSTAGSALSGPPTVAVQDSLGNTVTSSSASITVAIGTNPGGGTLSGTTTKSATAGVMSFGDLSIDKAGTGYTLTASATGLTGATSGEFNITAAAASQIAYTTQPLNSATGSAIGGPPTVTVQDGFGNTVSTSTAPITVAIGNNPGGGTLSGSTTVDASSGVAAFTGLSINQVGNGYTLTAAVTGLAGATSNPFNITGSSGLGIISGVVTRVSDGVSVSGALIEVFQGIVLVAMGSTTASGSYSVGGLADGVYAVRASYPGFVPQLQDGIAVVNAAPVTVNLRLNIGIAVYFPIAGGVINDYSVLVEGEFDTSLAVEVGISVNGVPARVDMETFSGLVAVSPQTTSITAILADKNGTTLASHTIPITVQASPPTLTLQPRPTEGIAPLTVSFELTSLVPITQVSLDANGDGTVDFQGSTLAGQTFIFPQPGLYYPAVTATNNSGATYSAVALIQVYDATSLDALIQQKWQGFKNALQTENTAAALLYIAQDERAGFLGLFQNLTVPLSAIDQVLTNIQFVQARGSTVEYEMLRTDSRGQLSYIVRFVLDKDGVWRIQNL